MASWGIGRTTPIGKQARQEKGNRLYNIKTNKYTRQLTFWLHQHNMNTLK